MRKVTINPTGKRVVLPNGAQYVGPATVTLTDEEFNRLSPTFFTSGIATLAKEDWGTRLDNSERAAAPQTINRTVGNFSLVSTSSVWTPLPGADADLDRVIDGVKPGEWIELFLDALTSNSANNSYFTFVPVVDGTPNLARMMKPPYGPHGWIGIASAFAKVSGWNPYQIVAEDISADGSITMRPYYLGQGTKTLYADATNPLQVGARGPF